jgi:putative oxidoreductase
MPAPSALARLRERLLNVCGKLSWLPPLAARLAIGLVFLQTGWGKLHGLDKVTDFFTELHIPAPAFNAALVAWTEFLGGALLIAGLLTRLAALPLAFSMLIAILTAKRSEIDGLGSLFGFSEFAYLLIFGWLAIAGPGAVSIDRLLAGWWKPVQPRMVPPVRSLADDAHPESAA